MHGACAVHAIVSALHVQGACVLHAWSMHMHMVKYGTCMACWGSEARMIAAYRAEVLARRTEREDLIVGRIAHEEPRDIAKQNM